MARSSSKLLRGIGGWFDIIKAIADAVLRAGGDDDVLKQVKHPDVADEIATLLMARAGISKPLPDTEGLEVFTIRVNGDDPRWQRIVRKDYAYCVERARTSHFPVKPGEREVTVALFPANYFGINPSNEEIIAEIKQCNLKNPDRAVTETILAERKEELAESPIVGVCGVVRSCQLGHLVVGCVRGLAGGLILDLHDLQQNWARHYRFAAVVSEQRH